MCSQSNPHKAAGSNPHDASWTVGKRVASLIHTTMRGSNPHDAARSVGKRVASLIHTALSGLLVSV